MLFSVSACCYLESWYDFIISGNVEESNFHQLFAFFEIFPKEWKRKETPEPFVLGSYFYFISAQVTKVTSPWNFTKKNISNNSSFLRALGPTIFMLLMSCLGYVNLFLPGADFFFWNLIVPELVKAFPAFYETHRFITVFKNVHSNSVTASYADC